MESVVIFFVDLAFEIIEKKGQKCAKFMFYAQFRCRKMLTTW